MWNNGKGIPIRVHKQEGVYIPELVLGQLLTGSNFDDTEAKITGGRNGMCHMLKHVSAVWMWSAFLFCFLFVFLDY